MSRTFKIRRNYYDTGFIYKKSEFTLEPGVTILVGCNGYGKSTMLEQIRTILDNENIKYISYDNEHDGGPHAMRKAGFLGNMELLANLFMSSEGEKIIQNVGEMAALIGKFVRNNTNEKELWIIFDAIDSGLSIDNMIDIKEYLFKTILNDTKNKDIDVYIVCSTNAFEMTNGNKCFDVYKQEYIEFKDYEDYKKFILNCKKRKNKRNESRK